MTECKNFYNKDEVDLSVVDENKRRIDNARPFSQETLISLKKDFDLR